MTNISNLNISKGSIPPLLKYKIVFLGDQAVGKSSIINRFIYDIFDGNEHVPSPPFSDQPSASTSSRKTSSFKIRPFAYNFGIQQDRNASKHSSQIIFATLPLPSSSMMSPAEILLKVYRSGLTM
jgi:GTPase SAR1 family protein